MPRDSLFNDDGEPVEPFRFDADVAAVFDDMANRSIPLYREMQALAASLVSSQIQPGDSVLDLGCSTETSIALIRQRIPDVDFRCVGVDASGPMLEQCRKKLSAFGCGDSVELMESDVRAFPEGEYRVVLCLYTLQFLPEQERVAFLQRIRENLAPGGVLLLAEKVRHATPSSFGARSWSAICSNSARRCL